MEAYGYKKTVINNLDNINNNSNNFYNYKGLNFLSKLKNKNKNIVIIFHGAISENKKGKFNVIFRGYDYNIKDTDILCISDYLLDKYINDYIVNWTLSTKKYSYCDKIYLELFKYLINQKKYINIFFTGTSAGGFPSIKFASYFNCTALISNAQLYLENYKKDNGLYYLFNMLHKYGDELNYEKKEIEKIILNSVPKKIIYYQNKKDNSSGFRTYDNFLEFKNFIARLNLEHICDFHLFEYPGKLPKYIKSQHIIQFPEHKKHLDILQKHLLN